MQVLMSVQSSALPLTTACVVEGTKVALVTQDHRITQHLKYQFGGFGIFEFQQIPPGYVHIRTDSWEAGVDPKHVVCFGAGVDSTVLLYKLIYGLKVPANDVVALYVNYKGPWSEKEYRQALKVEQTLQKDFPDLKFQYVALKTRKIRLINDYIVPGRNAMFMELASNLYPNAESILLAANYKKDDSSGALDKGRLFFGDMTDILSQARGHIVQCWSPVLHQTKLQAILELLTFKLPRTGNEIIQDILAVTTSCYDSESEACGICYACFKRNLALNTLKNEIHLPLDWSKIPHIDFLNDAIPSAYQAYLQREIAKGRKFSAVVMRSLEKLLNA